MGDESVGDIGKSPLQNPYGGIHGLADLRIQWISRSASGVPLE